MVQKKVPSKPGVQADQVKSSKLLVSLKPSSLQHQDIKNSGPDLKKKMKKSRPKRSDFECLSTPSLRRQVPQPGKPPPSISPSSAAASPQKKTPIKTSDTTPNYMKSTSSSDARKEKSQVSCRNLLPLFDSKSSNKWNSNRSEITSASVHKPARTLGRPSSLKLVRTLTKTTSFKPARNSANKCSPLALSENLNVQRATCSSTLKDSKFPTYLTLDSGGKEADGTPAMKVCPYTYCSLNGHQHPLLPPLKSFMSARRLMLKTQRSIKLGCLSPRRSKLNKMAMGKKEMGKVDFDEKYLSEEALNSSVIAPVIENEHDDFFIHIYSKEREAIADTSATSKHGENDLLPSDAFPNYHADGRVPEKVLDESPLSEIGYHDNSNQTSGCSISTDTNTAEYSPEAKQNTEEVEKDYQYFLATEESGLEGSSREHDEEESTGSNVIDGPEFGHSDVDWEEGRYSTFYLDDEVDNSLQTSPDYDLGGNSVEYDSFMMPDGSIFMSDEMPNTCFEEIRTGEIQAKYFEEENISFNAADFHQDFEIDEHIQGSCNQSHDQLELSTMEDSVEATADIEATKADPQVHDAPVKTNQTEFEAFTDYCDNQFVQYDDAAEQTWDLDSQDFHDITAQSLPEECKDIAGSQENVNLYQSDARIFINCINFQAFSGNTPPKKMDSESKTNSLKIDAGIAVEEKEKVDPFRAKITIEIIITFQDSSEAVKKMPRKDPKDNHLDDIAKDGKSNQTVADMDLPTGTQDHASEEKFISGGIENLDGLEENEAANFTSCESTGSGEQPHSPMRENSQGTEMETTTSLGEETCNTSKNTSDTGNGDELMEDNSDEEAAKTCKKLNETTKCKTSTEEQEELKEYNLRAPNFLPLEPDQESEKVDLRPQTIDDRRNSEEWMLDYALQQAVTKLAPARKKKVALLVEAFEKVLPVSKCETQMRQDSVVQARPMQACS